MSRMALNRLGSIPGASSTNQSRPLPYSFDIGCDVSISLGDTGALAACERGPVTRASSGLAATFGISRTTTLSSSGGIQIDDVRGAR